MFFLGVYLTSIDPSKDPKKMLLDYFDDENSDEVIVLKMDSKTREIQRLWANIEWVAEIDKGDVYLYTGDVDLKGCEYYTYKNSNTKDEDWTTLFF